MDCRAGRLSGRYRVVMYKPKKTKTEMKTGLLSLCCALMLFASCGKRIPKSDAVAIVPKPVSEQLSDSTFDLTNAPVSGCWPTIRRCCVRPDFFNGVVSKAFGQGSLCRPRRTGAKRCDQCTAGRFTSLEGYTLLITPDSIDIARRLSCRGILCVPEFAPAAACSRPGGRTGPG